MGRSPHARVVSIDISAARRVQVVLCAKTVPCGAAARTALAVANVSLTPVSYEQDVTATLTRVELREADAGLVCRTDVKGAAGKVDGVAFPEAARAINEYPIAALGHAPNPGGAAAFAALVRSAAGQKVLTDAGFLAPSASPPASPAVCPSA